MPHSTLLRYPLPSNKSSSMSDEISGDPGFEVVEPSQAGPSVIGGPTWPGDIGSPPNDRVFNKEAGHFMEEILREASSTLDFMHARKKVLEIIEDRGLHNQREDLFQWGHQLKLQSKVVPGVKGRKESL